MSAASVSWSLMTCAYTRSVMEGVRVTEPGGDHMHGHASQQQGCRMYMAKIVQPGTR